MSNINTNAARNMNPSYQTGLRAARPLGIPAHDCSPRSGSRTAAAYRAFRNAADTQMEPVRSTTVRERVRSTMTELGEQTGINPAARWTARNVTRPGLGWVRDNVSIPLFQSLGLLERQ